ncbi:MAG: hypothetical protein WBV82_00165 [Myxococcaceae bacterium]
MRASKDPEKARRAARDPRRPGEKCEASPGQYLPVVNRGRCEGTLLGPPLDTRVNDCVRYHFACVTCSILSTTAQFT